MGEGDTLRGGPGATRETWASGVFTSTGRNEGTQTDGPANPRVPVRLGVALGDSPRTDLGKGQPVLPALTQGQRKTTKPWELRKGVRPILRGSGQEEGDRPSQNETRTG